MKYVLVVVLVTTFAFLGCSKKEKEHDSPREYTLKMMDSKIEYEVARYPDTLSIPSGAVPERVAYVDKPSMTMIPTGVDTTATPVRTTPDFTDAGVGMLISNAGAEGASMIASCITPGISAWFSALSSGSPVLSLPSEYTVMEDCSTGTRVVWNASASQRASWNATSSGIRTNFINAINAYGTSLVTEGYYFPCTVVGLNFGASVYTPYIMVQIQRILDSSARIVEYRVILIPRPTTFFH